MDVLAHSFLFWAALIMALLALYILPTLIAVIRGTENLGWIVVINLLPTGIGWLAALVAAARTPPPPTASNSATGAGSNPTMTFTAVAHRAST